MRYMLLLSCTEQVWWWSQELKSTRAELVADSRPFDQPQSFTNEELAGGDYELGEQRSDRHNNVETNSGK
jgi:hypothetical protein